MSNKQKRNAKVAAREKREEQQGSSVVKWIFGVLVLLAIGFACYSVWLAS